MKKTKKIVVMLSMLALFATAIIPQNRCFVTDGNDDEPIVVILPH